MDVPLTHVNQLLRGDVSDLFFEYTRADKTSALLIILNLHAKPVP